MSYRSRALEQSGPAGDRTEANRPLVILVDDDDGLREALHELMLSVGLDAISFGSTRDLLEAELPDRPGCLVADVRMPGVSGLDLQHRLVESGNTKPVVFITAHADESVRPHLLGQGAVECLLKPFSDTALLGALNAAFREG